MALRRAIVFLMAPSLASELSRDQPLVHGGGGYCFALAPGALAWIEQNVASESATLETGIGVSTLVFAAAGAWHDVIAPGARRGRADRRRSETQEHRPSARHVPRRPVA